MKISTLAQASRSDSSFSALVVGEPSPAVEGLGNGVLEMEGNELGPAAAQHCLDLDPSLRAIIILAPGGVISPAASHLLKAK